jgi:hypothetical protein
MPSADSRALYDELFELYESLYPATREIVHRLAAIDDASSRPATGEPPRDEFSDPPPSR